MLYTCLKNTSKLCYNTALYKTCILTCSVCYIHVCNPQVVTYKLVYNIYLYLHTSVIMLTITSSTFWNM